MFWVTNGNGQFISKAAEFTGNSLGGGLMVVVFLRGSALVRFLSESSKLKCFHFKIIIIPTLRV